MSEKNPIRIFVTHTFAENPDYLRVFEYLESSPNFFYVNCSAPQSLPATGGKEALKEELRKQIKNAEVAIVLAGMYIDNRDWVTYQMDAAQAVDLPLVVVEPFGGMVKMPPELASRAAEVVGWNERNIIDAVRRQARHEDTARWEVIEFDMSAD
jgi:hypothetical protein